MNKLTQANELFDARYSVRAIRRRLLIHVGSAPFGGYDGISFCEEGEALWRRVRRRKTISPRELLAMRGCTKAVKINALNAGLPPKAKEKWIEFDGCCVECGLIAMQRMLRNAERRKAA